MSVIDGKPFQNTQMRQRADKVRRYSQTGKARESRLISNCVPPRPCRFCSTSLKHTFVDLGMSPLANTYLKPDQLNEIYPYYPLHVRVCERCFLVQLEEFETPKRIFSDYPYFSSYSDGWLQHARCYTDMVVERFVMGLM